MVHSWTKELLLLGQPWILWWIGKLQPTSIDVITELNLKFNKDYSEFNGSVTKIKQISQDFSNTFHFIDLVGIHSTLEQERAKKLKLDSEIVRDKLILIHDVAIDTLFFTADWRASFNQLMSITNVKEWKEQAQIIIVKTNMIKQNINKMKTTIREMKPFMMITIDTEQRYQQENVVKDQETQYKSVSRITSETIAGALVSHFLFDFFSFDGNLETTVGTGATLTTIYNGVREFLLKPRYKLEYQQLAQRHGTNALKWNVLSNYLDEMSLKWNHILQKTSDITYLDGRLDDISIQYYYKKVGDALNSIYDLQKKTIGLREGSQLEKYLDSTVTLKS